MDEGLRRALKTVPHGTSIVLSLTQAGVDVPVEVHDRAGTLLGRFVVERELGAGGMGRVYAARDPDLCRLVAIKVLERQAWNATAVERFVSEARIGSQLTHPGIVPVHELGVDADGRLFLVMRYVDGSSMRQALSSLGHDRPLGRWTRRRLLRALVQVCEAVGFAHQTGVVHRDLKPENVMLGPFGEVQVVDWGLAVQSGDHTAGGTPTTLETSIVGTPGYLAPEQTEHGREVGPRADVFALGAILVEVLTGRPAFGGRDAVERIAASLLGHADLLGLDEVVSDLARRALSVDPAARMSDANALAEAIATWEDGDERSRRARVRVADGRSALLASIDTQRLLAVRAEEIQRRQQTVDPKLPLDHPHKVALHALLDSVEALRIEAAEAHGRTLAAGESALALDPGNPGARSLLADAYAARMTESEARGETAEAAMLASRVAEFDDGHLATFLKGMGAVTLSTDPPGARVVARRFQRTGVVWGLGPPIELGSTPLRAVDLDRGSWLLEFRSPGCADVTYPLQLGRGESFDAGEVPVRLLREDEIGAGWVYVPGGPYLRGGDPQTNTPRPLETVHAPGFLAAVLPVTVEAWHRWVNTLGEAAMASAPRQYNRGLWTEANGRVEVPDSWSMRWPIHSVDWRDAGAYAASVGARLPTEDEWEKMARGADARLYPWGDRFDASLCSNLHGHSGKPVPTEVGAYPRDRSVYGVRDLAGSMRTWCGEAAFDGDPTRRAVRGGCWTGGAQLGRCAARFGQGVGDTQAYLGVRLVRDLPPR